MLLRLYSYVTWAFLALLGGRRKAYVTNNLVLRYAELGPRNAETWVLLHGLGATSITWSSVLRALRGEARLIVPELSALGGSRCPRGGLGVQDGAAAIIGLIEAVAPGQQIVLGGMSLGAWIAIRVTLERPDLIERLLLIDAAGYRDQDWERIERLVTVANRRDVERLYRAMYAKPPWILRVSKGTFLAAYTSPTVQHVLDSTTIDDAYGPPELRKITCPVGLIWGRLDRLFLIETGRAIHEALPNSKMIELEGVGHAVNWEAPRQLVRSVREIQRWWA